MAEIRNEYGGCSIERCINFERREGYMENMRVEVKTDAMLSPEKTKVHNSWFSPPVILKW